MQCVICRTELKRKGAIMTTFEKLLAALLIIVLLIGFYGFFLLLKIPISTEINIVQDGPTIKKMTKMVHEELNRKYSQE